MTSRLKGRITRGWRTHDSAPRLEHVIKFQADYKRRGFSRHDAEIMHLTPYAAEEVKRRFPLLPVHGSGVHIPYFDLSGKPTGFYRFRFFDVSPNGFGALVGRKPLRYAQESGSVNEIYLPPFVDWQELAKDAAKPLIITEGELKAAYTTKRGYPTLGLGGDWLFKNGNGLLPQFAEFAWEERIVYLCYDSDAATNAQIAAAESALARALLHRKAQPHIARAPALPELKKTGLDDFLLARGTEALDAVLAEAKLAASAEELFRLNAEVVYIKSPATGIVVRVQDCETMSHKSFVEHAYAPRIFTVKQTINKKGDTKSVEKSAPREWLKWPHRAECERITYAPGQSRITDANEFNMWPGWGCEAKQGDIALWVEMLDFLFAGHEASHKWFEQWLAYPLQFPGTKLATAVLLHGAQGTGKSLVGETLFRVYGKNATEITNRDLEGTYNAWSASKQFIMGTEIGIGSARGDRKRALADYVKVMVTQKEVRINGKYVPHYNLPDVMNFYFTSNAVDALYLEDDDRRLFVHEVPSKPRDQSFYARYGAWMESPEGPAALFWHLRQLDLTGFDPNAHAPRTVAKQEMIAAGRSDVAAWVAQLRDDADATLIGKTEQDAGVRIKWELWTTRELMDIYDPDGKGRVTETGMGNALKAGGILKLLGGAQIEIESPGKAVVILKLLGGKQIEIKSLGKRRLWAVRNVEYWRQRNHTGCSKEMAWKYIDERKAKF
ncbi:MAG: DUF5906 domain-containing protein [Terriglobales bacterium]